MPHHPHRPMSGFTLIELLVVISIIALMISILLPVLSSSREQGRTMQCTSGMRQWGIAVQAYLVDFDDFLPQEGNFQAAVTATAGNGLTSGWYNALPPYVDAPKYMEIYDGATNVGTTGGYKNEWIWYCPSRILIAKNSGSGLNGAHYGMNATLNGSGSSATRIDYTPGLNQPFTRMTAIPAPSAAVYLGESATAANVSPHSVLKDRHQNYKAGNLSFLDGHASTLLADRFEKPAGAYNAPPAWGHADRSVVWGPFRN